MRRFCGGPASTKISAASLLRRPLRQYGQKTNYSTFMVNSPILFPYSITSRPRRKAFSLFIAAQIYLALRASSLSAVLCFIRVLVQSFNVKADRSEAVVTAYHCRLGVSSSSRRRNRRHRVPASLQRMTYSPRHCRSLQNLTNLPVYDAAQCIQPFLWSADAVMLLELEADQIFQIPANFRSH